MLDLSGQNLVIIVRAQPNAFITSVENDCNTTKKNASRDSCGDAAPRVVVALSDIGNNYPQLFRAHTLLFA